MHIFDKVIDAQLTPTISTNAYIAGDVVGGLLQFNVASPSGVGILNAVRVVDDDNEKAELTLYLFNAAPTSIVDADPFAPTVADLKKLIAKIVVEAADYVTVNGNAYALKSMKSSSEDLNDVYKAAENGVLYGYLVCTATPTYAAATDLTVTISVLTS